MKALRPDAFEEPVGPVDALYRDLRRKLRGIPGVLRAECLALWDDCPKR